MIRQDSSVCKAASESNQQSKNAEKNLENLLKIVYNN